MKTLFLVMTLVSQLYAHGIRTAYLEITENTPGKAEVLVKQVVYDPGLKIIFPKDCTLPETDVNQLGNIRHFILDCSSPLKGQTFKVSGLGQLTNEMAVRYSDGGNFRHSSLIGQKNPNFTVPKTSTYIATLCSYIKLGVEHIFSGPDHLLFILGLLLLVGEAKALLWTVTAFTIAHSITLSLTSIHMLKLPSSGAEAAIALSLVLLALDLEQKKKGLKIESEPTSIKQILLNNGVRVAFVFGLVHGLGFAGALREVGLPEDSIGLSLFGFNIGVEIGQLIFLSLTHLVLQASKKIRMNQLLAKFGTYSIGIFGAYWLIERTIHWL